MLRHDDPSVVDTLGIRLDSLLRAFQLGHTRRDEGPRAALREISGVSACAALYRIRALETVADPGDPPAVFDPTFFAYYEDVDLALRLARKHWVSYLVPTATCEHAPLPTE